MMQPTAIDDATLRRLKDRALDTTLPQVLVLPSQVRDRTAYYSEVDLEAVKVARSAGIDADFLDRGDDLRFLGEYSADVLLQFAIAVSQQLTVDGVAAVAKYLLEQLGSLHRRGVIRSPEETRIRVDVQRVEVRTPTSHVAVEGLTFEAVGRHAVTQVLRGIADGPIADAVVRELELPDDDARP